MFLLDRVAGDYWQAWKDFEVKHGNEDTLREMLRIKRSVSHTFNTQINMMSAQMLSSTMQQQVRMIAMQFYFFKNAVDLDRDYDQRGM